jgi:hypothetical protein
MKHDENKDLRSVSRIARVNLADKSINCSKTATIGIHMWGKLDFLTKYCGWHFIWDNTAGVGSLATDDKSVRDLKNAKKERKLSDKTKRK